MKKITETALLDFVKSLTDAINVVENEQMGDEDELQTMLARNPSEQESSPSQSINPSDRMGSEEDLKGMQGSFKRQELAAQPNGLDDMSKQSTSDNFARPFYSPKANDRDKFTPSPEDSFYNPTYTNSHFDQDFTPNQQEVDQAVSKRQQIQGQENPRTLIQTPNGVRMMTLHPTDKIAESIDRIMQIANWKG